VRLDLGQSPATHIWPWGAGRKPDLAPFAERFGLSGAVIGAVDLIRGIGKLIGWDLIDVEGATGYIDTNYAGKGQAAIEALDRYDLVVVHIEAPDEAGHAGDVAAKVAAIESIDKHIVGPVLKKLKSFDHWRILVAPDHLTPCAVRTHDEDPVPFAMAGSEVTHVFERPYNEKSAREADLHIEDGHELMEYFLHFAADEKRKTKSPSKVKTSKPGQ
jgi:2,3-bisphosphoglycerate-independent phosphoglycerate mutase